MWTKTDFENVKEDISSSTPASEDQLNQGGHGDTFHHGLQFYIYACPNHRETKYNCPGSCPSCGTSLIWFI